MATYSFLDFACAFEGPGIFANLGSGSGAAEEGITFASAGDKSTMTIGADGTGVHSLRADNSGTLTVRLLKTSPVNAQLMQAYNFQTSSSLFHGKNTVTGRDAIRGDVITFKGVAFKKLPDLNYATEAGTVEWTFDAIQASAILGVGTPEL